MKRQHYAIGANDSPEDDGIGTCYCKSKRLPPDQPPSNQTHSVMHPACLLRLSHDALSEIMTFVDLPSIIKLCASGAGTTALINSCVSSIDIESSNSSSYARHVSHGLVQMMKQGLFANLRHLHITNTYKIFTETKEKWLSLADLPASLTSLSLDNVMLNVEWPFDAKNLYQLANLKTLSLQSLRFSRCDGDFDVCLWIKQLLAHPTNLLELVYIQHEMDDEAATVGLIASSLPNTLESLTAHPTLLCELTPTQWPPNLTALRICEPDRGRPPNCPSRNKQLKTLIPITVTRLDLHQTVNVVCGEHQVMKNMCLTDPLQIRHLTVVDWRYVSSYGLMETISNFSNLEYLDLNGTLIGKDTNFNLIPRSVKTIMLGSHPRPSKRWHQLPPDAQYVDTYPEFLEPAFHFRTAKDDMYKQHLPRLLTHISVTGGFLPRHFPILQHVSFINPHVLPRRVCSLYFEDLPKTLRSMDITLSESVGCDVFWLHDESDQPLAFERQFPLLTKLRMTWNTRVSNTQLMAWIQHLPRTITELAVSIYAEGSALNNNSCGELDLRDAKLPPHLKRLRISRRDAHLTAPCNIPKSLQSLYLLAMSIRNGSELYEAIRDQIHEDAFLCTLNSRRLHLENLEYANGNKRNDNISSLNDPK